MATVRNIRVVSFVLAAIVASALGGSQPSPATIPPHTTRIDDPAYPAAQLSAEQALADLALLETTLNAIHPGYDRYRPRAELDRAFDALRAEVAAGTTDERLYLGVSRALELIRCDHTKAEYPASLREWREANPTHLPFHTRIFGDRVFIEATASPQLLRGDEILSINNVPVPRLLAEVLPLISIDGRTDHARAPEAERSGEYMGSGLDHFLPLLHGWSSEFALRIRRAGQEREVRADALTYAAYEALGAPGPSDFADAVFVDRPGDASVAVLRVDTFINYRRPVNARELLARVFTDLNAAGVEHLIVDLRANGGGSDDAAEALAAHLIREPVVMAQGARVRCTRVPDALRPHLNTWDTSVFDPPAELFEPMDADGLHPMRTEPSRLEPAPDAFTGRVTLLSSKANASGTTMLLAGLSQRAGARVVGEPTGGSVEGPTAGIIFFLKLPASGITVRVPAIRTDTGLAFEPGMGLIPDVIVTLTREAWLAGRDEVLEAAMRN